MHSYFNTITILVVEDSASTRTQIKNILLEANICQTVVEATNGIEAMKKLTSIHADLIICDIMMPKMDGFRFLTILNESSEFKDIPVILLSSLTDLSKKVKGLNIGAWDFITKPFEPLELLARAKAMLRIKHLQDNLKSRMSELEQLSIIDSLTGLYNKKHLFEYITKKMSTFSREKKKFGCIMIDIDNFKILNDTYGHILADSILREIGNIFNTILRGPDFAARYGGDEFIIVINMKEPNSLFIVTERIRKILENYNFSSIDKKISKVQVTVSLGSAIFPDKNIRCAEDLINKADQKLYEAKESGRNCSRNPKLESIT